MMRRLEEEEEMQTMFAIGFVVGLIGLAAYIPAAWILWAVLVGDQP